MTTLPIHEARPMESIVRVLGEIALFLAFAPPEQIDREIADKILETVGGAVAGLSEADRAQFNSVMLEMAGGLDSPTEAALLRSLAGQWRVGADGTLA